MKNLSVALLGLLFPLAVTAQTAPPAPADAAETAAAPAGITPLTTYAFADGYYGYDITSKGLARPGFLYSHPRNNEFALNNGIIGVRYDDGQVRGALGLHAGTYVEANYAAEPAVLQHIYEGYAGFRPFQKTWLDVGIFASHIGFESAMSKDNWTLTRSLMAENSPYFESGARFTYEASAKLTLTALALNGWQNLRDRNHAKATGWQIQWKPTDKVLINSSSFYGNEQPQDSARRRRFFHNFYATYTPSDRIALAVVFDVGKQQRAPGETTKYDTWHTGAAFVKVKLAERWSTTLRGEYYKAARSVVIGSLTPLAGDANYFVRGGSLNVDYLPTAHVAFRVEGRLLNAKESRFADRAGAPADTYANLTSSIALSF